MQNIARDYILLAFAIDQHLPGYIDAYFGPEDVRTEAMTRGKLPLPALVTEAERLTQAIESGGLEVQRAEFLTAQVAAMRATLGLLSGQQLPLAREVELLYGLAPEWMDESHFAEAHPPVRTAAAAGRQPARAHDHLQTPRRGQPCRGRAAPQRNSPAPAHAGAPTLFAAARRISRSPW